MNTDSNNGTMETYMMPGTGTGPNPQVLFMQPPEGVDYMSNEVAPGVIYDQGAYYPAANYYGYFCTGFEPQSEWEDHHRIFGLDGQEPHYSAFHTENSPYVYYSPNYGYAQSSYNPYNPYIPGAVIGVDSPIIGTEQYFSSPPYQLSVSSPAAYIPVVIEPNSEPAPNIAAAPSVLGTVPSIPSSQTGSKHSRPGLSSTGASASQVAASRVPKSEASHVSSTETGINLPLNKQSSSLGSAKSFNVTQMTQGRNSALMQVTDHLFHGSASSVESPLKVSSGNLLSNFGTGARGWTTAGRFRSRFPFNGQVKSENMNPDILSEQNRGPRTNKSKSQWASTMSDGLLTSNMATNNSEEAIIICADQYNEDDLSVECPDAKFFVIKSYSEDDVHKSIKYNVWSSTPNGNKRLDTAYMEAQRISNGEPESCPIFLFFSVNASGQFCGVAKMVGPVDFDKDMNFWQQDKWTGSFPVKWLIIKDVPNTSFRHILLENNENKPVTNSRDTQEITYVPGMSMLKIFKDSPLKTSILDDFMFYEERQKIMMEEKSRFIGSSCSSYIPAVVVPHKPIDSAKQNDSAEGSGSEASVASNSLLVDDRHASTSLQTVTDDGYRESDAGKPSHDEEDIVNPISKGDANMASSVAKMKSLSIGLNEDVRDAATVESSPHSDVFTVGSMHIKVNGTTEATTKSINVGYSPVEPKASKTDQKGATSDDGSSQK